MDHQDDVWNALGLPDRTPPTPPPTSHDWAQVYPNSSWYFSPTGGLVLAGYTIANVATATTTHFLVNNNVLTYVDPAQP